MYRVTSEYREHGQARHAKTVKLRSISAAVKLATANARRGYFATVADAAQDDLRNRDQYGNHPHRGYLAICAPARKRGKNYAKCKIARKIVAELRRAERSR